jgi:hypothetical protein
VEFLDGFGRYFWLIILCVWGVGHILGARAAAALGTEHPAASVEARFIRRWFAVATGFSIGVMGLGMTVGGVSNIGQYFFPPTPRNPYISAWIWSACLNLCLYAYWIFFHTGAEKTIRYRLHPFAQFVAPFPRTAGYYKKIAVFGLIAALFTMIDQFIR